MYFAYGLQFPDSEEGFQEAKNKFNSMLLEFHKMKVKKESNFDTLFVPL